MTLLCHSIFSEAYVGLYLFTAPSQMLISSLVSPQKRLSGYQQVLVLHVRSEHFIINLYLQKFQAVAIMDLKLLAAV